MKEVSLYSCSLFSVRANGCHLTVSLSVSSPDAFVECDETKETPRPSIEAQEEAAAAPDINIGMDNIVTAELEESVLLPISPTLHIALPAVELGRPTYHEAAIEQDKQHTEKHPALTTLSESPSPPLYELIQEHEETQPATPIPALEDSQGYSAFLPSWSTLSSTSTYLGKAIAQGFETTISRPSPEKPDKLVAHPDSDQISDEYVESEITVPMQPSSSSEPKKKSKKARRREAKMRKLFQDISGPSTGVAQAPAIDEEPSVVSTTTEEPFLQHDPILIPDTVSYVNRTVTPLVHERGITEVGLVSRIESSEHMQANDGKDLTE